MQRNINYTNPKALNSMMIRFALLKLFVSCTVQPVGESRVSGATGLVNATLRISTHGILRKFQHHLVINCDITYMATL